MDGYRAHRAPAVAERDALPEACRFGVAYVGAVRFLWARERGWDERLDRSLTRLRARHEAAGRSAELAQDALR